MSVTLNAKGTSVPYFGIGKAGITLYQGLNDPTIEYSVRDGDYWFDATNNSLKVFSAVTSVWGAPRLDSISFLDNTISSDPTMDLILSPGLNKEVVISGTGNGLITIDNFKDLVIDPSVGGGGRLILGPLVWPDFDGTANQILGTDGNGYLIWIDLPTPVVLTALEERVKVLETKKPANGTAALKELQNKVACLEEMIKGLLDKLNELSTKKKPGRPPKQK